MAFDYSSVAESALDALREYGASVTRRAFTAGTYDKATGKISGASATDSTRTGALFDFGAGQTSERGTLIQGGDKRLLLDATGPVLPSDHFIIAGADYTIISIGEVGPAGTIVLYDLHLRT